MQQYGLYHDIGNNIKSDRDGDPYNSFPTVYGLVMLLTALAFITRFRVKKPGMKTMFAFLGVGAVELVWLLYKTKFR